MRLAVVSCWSYRDAWNPFLELLEKFWPAHPPVTLITDRFHSYDFKVKAPYVFTGPGSGWQWCQLVAFYASTINEPVILMQEDFLINEKVDDEAIRYGLAMLQVRNAGCIRIYPCPGGTEDIGDPYIARIPKGTTARISCQAAIWEPRFLNRVATKAQWTTSEAGDFENLGTPAAEEMPQEVLGFKRDVQPWPIQYLNSGITRSLWNPDSIRLFEQHGIDVDRSMRMVGA